MISVYLLFDSMGYPWEPSAKRCHFLTKTNGTALLRDTDELLLSICAPAIRIAEDMALVDAL